MPTFEDPETALPLPMSRKTASFSPVDPGNPNASVVRHAGGYGPFVKYATSTGGAPENWNASEVADFITLHGPHISSSPELRWAAGIFLGNAAIAASTDASWKVFSDESPEAWMGETGLSVLPVVDALASGNESARKALEQILTPST